MNSGRPGSTLRLSAALSLVVLLTVPFAVSAQPKGAKIPKSTKTEARDLYAKKDFEGARRLFSKKVAANPSDAESYYYLGNCYVAMRNYPAALAEYKRANEIAGDNSIGAASRSAITGINNILHPTASASQAAPTANAKAAKVMTGDAKEGDEEKKDPRLAAAEAEGQAKIAEAEKQAQRILNDAETRCKPIKAEEESVAADITANQGRGSGGDSAKQVINDARVPYEEQIKNIMDPAKRSAQQLRDAAKAQADDIKQRAAAKK